MAGGNIKVVVRVRPFNGRELDRKAKCVVQMKDTQTILIPPPDADERLRGSKGTKALDGQKTFAFDKSYWSFNRQDPHFAGQDNLFSDLGAPLLDNAFQGYNNCIFAYGQTGSGKSYSMMGYGEESGVIPRICQNMFERITAIQKDKTLKCTVEVSYLEIYNERVRDLLNPSTKGNLKVREHPSTGPYVEDLAKLVVRSFQEIENLMDEGNKARTVAATNMNETSSRSHAVFTLTLTQKRHDVETSMDTEKVAKISLVDLAGSERATSTGATGARLKEGAEINRSLSTLGRVIAALADLSTGKKKNMSMVPYRDSILTWLLKDSLGGNSLTAMIAAISPADINFEETLSTLRYADSAKRIKNHAVVNEDPNARMIRELKEELAQLRSKLGSGATSGGVAEEQYAPDTPLDQQIVSITQADGSIKKVSKADIAEQLNQSEKLYEDLNQTWEEKLQKTELIHKEREAALEELGISIEKGFVGLSTPKKMPHLVNLSDDPLLAECLVYNIKPGSTTVSNVEDSNSTSEIKLNGSKILRDHCTFENVDGVVTVIPREGATIMVNGLRIDKPRRLRSGFRIILGDFHIFRFNHPLEARAERAEQSLLRHSVATSQLGSPAPRPGHERTLSKAISDVDGENSRSESPIPVRIGRDSDWSFARREAASAILGADQKINHLTDDELDSLFDDVQRARAVRRGRPESRLNGLDEEDSESTSSYPVREKYMSNGTADNFSVDTALTMPGTPQQDGDDVHQNGEGNLQLVRESMQAQLDKQKEEFQEQLKGAESVSHDVEELRSEKERMETALMAAKEDFQKELQQQKEAFEAQMQQMRDPIQPSRCNKEDGVLSLSDRERLLVRNAVRRWQQIRYVVLVRDILQRAALMKEAQVMSQAMDKHVVFQFTVVGQGHDMTSSYDLVLSGISGDDDEPLEIAKKPCIAARVIDFQHSAIHLWSFEKLEHRVQTMRQMHQYISRPDYRQHFRPENPFVDPFLPQFSLIGNAHVPLAAVFGARVQDYAVPVVSPYTQEAVGIIKLSLEPSSAEAPPSMLKFNAVMHDMTGFPEREGTDVHAQMFVPGITEEEGGATTTQMIRDFDEGPIRFESVHSMSVPLDGPRTASLQVAIFARVTSMHLEKVLSWDEMREYAAQDRKRDRQPKKARLPESEFFVEEKHDVFAKLQILEMSETGEYVPVEVEQHSNTDPGTYQLHQGLQRRIVVNMTHNSSESLGWEEVSSMRVGGVRLIDPWGKVPDLNTSPDIPLKLVQDPSIHVEENGTSHITLLGQWDSSLHDSALLDRPTAERYSVQMTLSCDVASTRTDSIMTFAIDQTLQIRPRSWLRPQSMFKQLWKTTRVVHTTVGIFSVTLKPTLKKKAADLWRLDSQYQYVKGEEELRRWSPRGISLVQDFVLSQQRRQHRLEVEAAKFSLPGQSPIPNSASNSSSPTSPATYSPRQHEVLEKAISLWKKSPSFTLPTSLTDLPCSPRPLSHSSNPSSPHLIATVSSHPKSPLVLKSGYLLVPCSSSSSSSTNYTSSSNRWLRRFAELRPPYLHIYSVPDGDEIAIINLSNARIDVQPEVAKLLAGERMVGNFFAIYGRAGSWVFAARSEAQKGEWVVGLDRMFLAEADADA
ncbi:kinesin-like protein Klp8 [Loxospora ochrophaea]|nr:kinesin-like protein Klp8 [Loxospora ochrophaea]